MSPAEECDPALWIRNSDERRVSSLTQQMLGQENGFALLMLLAETVDEDEAEHGRGRW
jgi:hypothetical protein